MALTSADAWAMVAAAQQAGRVLAVHGAGSDGIWRTVKGRIGEGLLGRLRQINIAQQVYRRWFWGVDPLPEGMQAMGKMVADNLGVPVDFFDGWPGWQGNPEKMGGGAFVDMGVYQVTLALWLAGAPALEMAALTELAGMPVDAFVNAQARLRNGVLFSMSFADAVREPFMGARFGRPSMILVGDEGLLFGDKEGTVWLHRGGDREELEAEMEDTTPMAGFVASVLDGKPTLIAPEVGAWAVEFIEAMYASAAEGRIVRIERHNP
jgi:predicted dehydrogenase